MNEAAEHVRQINAFTASYARTHAAAYTSSRRSGYFYLRRQELVEAELKRLCLRDGRLLDVGCGAGHMGSAAARHGYQYTGVDLSPDMIQAARQVRFHPAGKFELGSADSLPYAAGHFDVVLALGVLEYVPRGRLPRCVSELTRVARPGGTVLVSLLSAAAPLWQVRAARETAAAVRARVRGHRPFRSPEHRFSRREATTLLAGGGLAVDRVVGYSFAQLPEATYARAPAAWARRLAPLERRGAGVLGAFGMAQFLVARRPAR